MLIVGPVLLWSQFRSTDNHGWQEAVTGTVAALVGMVPEGLVLLTSLAFMVGTMALARKQTLVQELPAVEVLARVDVVCLDKTGTLTSGNVSFDRLEPMDGVPERDVGQALGLLSKSDGANATAAAIALAFPDTDWTLTANIPFSSARKWSAVSSGSHGQWVFGAPEMVLPIPQGSLQQDAHRSALTPWQRRVGGYSSWPDQRRCPPTMATSGCRKNWCRPRW